MTHSVINKLEKLFPDQRLRPVDYSLAGAAQARLDNLTKPRGSLGRLEEIAARLYMISEGRTPLSVDPAIMLVCAGDHGVSCQGVSPFPQAVTRQMLLNFLNKGAAINALCGAFNISLKIIDTGCAGESFPAHPMLIDRRVAAGTQDFSQGPAMTDAQCEEALIEGFKIGLCAAREYSCLCLGEMGIGNSTSAAALYCAYYNLSPDKAAGPGAGAGAAMLARKKEVIRRALEIHGDAVRSQDPFAILAALGGFEIAMLAGIMLSCAASHSPFLIDGFICAAACAAALKICPSLSGYAFFSHSSAEPGFSLALSNFPEKPKPLLDMGMRLGEGSGCALALPILRGACAIFNNMATMDEALVSAKEEDRLD